MDRKYISDNKRVVLITGDSTKWYEQAIIIVRKQAAEQGDIDFIKEAEKIIQNYMTGAAGRTPKTPEVKTQMPSAAMPPKFLPKLQVQIKNGQNREGASNAPGMNNPAKKPASKKKSALDHIVNAVIFISCAAIIVLIAGAFI